MPTDKALGGAAGAMLMATSEYLITSAKIWQRRAGGNAFTLGYEVIDCERGFNTNIGTFARKRDKMIDIVESIKATTKHYKLTGQPILTFVPSEATCCQVRTKIEGITATELYAARDKVQERLSIRVLERVFPAMSLDEKLAHNRAGETDEDIARNDTSKSHTIEWAINNVTENIEKKTFVDGFVALCELIAAQK
jgi:hypothetical protein